MKWIVKSGKIVGESKGTLLSRKFCKTGGHKIRVALYMAARDNGLQALLIEQMSMEAFKKSYSCVCITDQILLRSHKVVRGSLG